MPLQAGRKTQTRRPLYPQPSTVRGRKLFREDGREIVCPFGVAGDRLWVRERFAFETMLMVLLIYAADTPKRHAISAVTIHAALGESVDAAESRRPVLSDCRKSLRRMRGWRDMTRRTGQATARMVCGALGSTRAG